MAFRLFSMLFLLLSTGGTPGPSPTGSGTVYVYMAIDTESRDPVIRRLHEDLHLDDFSDTGAVSQVMTESFRDQFRDSYGGRIKFTWFLLTQMAYLESAQHDESILFKEFGKFRRLAVTFGDTIGWHYHHCDWRYLSGDSGEGRWEQLRSFDGTRCFHGTDRGVAEQIIARVVLNDNYYPCMIHSGFGWENNDFSCWLDSLVPFDYTNLSPLSNPPSVAAYDWSRAPVDWSCYHPDSGDYQKPGGLKRTIFRCFPGHRESDLNLLVAFDRARRGQDALVGCYTHTFNDLPQFCRVVASALKHTSELLPGVKFRYVTALEGTRRLLGYVNPTPPDVTLKQHRRRYLLSSDRPLFGVPFGALKDSDGTYVRRRPESPKPVLHNGRQEWTFDLSTDRVEEFAVGCCDPEGSWTVVRPAGR